MTGKKSAPDSHQPIICSAGERVLKIAKMVFINGCGDHGKIPGPIVRSFDVICWVILVASYVPSIGLSFPICEIQSFGPEAHEELFQTDC